MDSAIFGLLVPLAVALAIGSVSTLLVLRRRVELGWRYLPFVAITTCFIGSMVALLMTVHCVAVAVVWLGSREGHWVAGEPRVVFHGLPWDFRIYSLLLFGTIGVACGIACVVAGAGLANLRPGAHRRCVGASLAMIGLFAPVIPLQHFATPAVAAALFNVAALTASGLRRRSPDRAREGSSLHGNIHPEAEGSPDLLI
jgi:hypothetical protein